MILKKCLVLSLLILQVCFLSDAFAKSRPHDHISPLTNGANAATLRFLPKFHRVSGCNPYTAVDKDGNYNGGLQDSGSESGKCTAQDKQQVYTRSEKVNADTYAIMYAYYFPKDNGTPIPSIGHRHDWEHVVVFVKDLNGKNEKIVGAAYSAHGGVSSTKTPNKSGNQVYVSYGYHGSFTHSLEEGTKGSNSKMVLISWNNLPSKAKATLNNQSFGSAVVPFKDSGDRFNDQIEKARKALNI